MPEANWPQAPEARALVDDAVARVLKQYRLEEAAARGMVEECFLKHPKLGELLGRGDSPAEVMRTRAYDQALVAAKRTVYNALRRYSSDQKEQSALIAQLEAASNPAEVNRCVDELTRSHASTRERLASRDEFYAKLQECLGAEHPRSILDVGCGLHPLLHPATGPLAPEVVYFGADKDAMSVAAVNAFGRSVPKPKVHAIQWDIREGWAPAHAAAGVSQFDVAYLFKLIPVVERQSPELMEILLRTPAKTWVITGSMVALAKKRDIERRERGTLLRFCREAKREIRGEFVAGEEFGMVLA